jgi:hypothetical protein
VTGPTTVPISDDAEAVYEYFEREGWGDGHPIVPPTEERVARFLSHSNLDPDEQVGVFPPAQGVATIRKLVINAVMAGCLPEHMDVVLAVMHALGESPGRDQLHMWMTTTHSVSPLLVVSGPSAKRIGITSGAQGSAVSWRANAAIARAVRLSLLNLAGIRGVTDANTFGWLAKYLYCIAEDEDWAGPWETFRVEKGYLADDDVVAVFWKEPAYHLELHWPASAQEMLAAFCDSMCTTASRSSYGEWNLLLGMSPRHASACADAGFSKKDVKRFIYEHARRPLRVYGPNAPSTFTAEWKKFYTHSPDAMVPMISSPGQIDVIVFGGAGPESLYFGMGGAPIVAKIGQHFGKR